jgi:hypothetical protein
MSPFHPMVAGAYFALPRIVLRFMSGPWWSERAPVRIADGRYPFICGHYALLKFGAASD